MKNKLTDLNDHLFAQLERLADENLKGEHLTEEIKRAHTIANVARQIIDNGSLVLKAQTVFGDGLVRTKAPAMLAIEDQGRRK